MINNSTEQATVTFEDSITKQKIIIALKAMGDDLENRELSYEVTFDPEIINPQNSLGLIGELTSFFLASLSPNPNENTTDEPGRQD